jgi:hypothetical protein
MKRMTVKVAKASSMMLFMKKQAKIAHMMENVKKASSMGWALVWYLWLDLGNLGKSINPDLFLVGCLYLLTDISYFIKG